MHSIAALCLALLTFCSHASAQHAYVDAGFDGASDVVPPPLPWLSDAGRMDATVGTAVIVTPLSNGASVVATGRGVSVTAQELVRRVQDGSDTQQRQWASDPATLEALLDRLVGDRLMVQEARRLGLENDPAVRAVLERALIAQLRATAITQRADATPVTDEQIRAFYDANLYRFHIPERRRAVVIFTADRTRLEREMRRWHRLRRPQLRRAFRAAAIELNRDAELARTDNEMIDVTLNRDDVDSGLRQAIFALAEEGDVMTDAVAGTLRGARGVYVARLVSIRQAIDRPLAEVSDWIRGRVQLERRVRAEEELVRRLAQEAAVRRTPASSVVRLQVIDAGRD